MKKISILFINAVLLSTFFLASCNKDDDNDNPSGGSSTPTETRSLVKEIKNNGYLGNKLEYTNNLLTKVTSYDTTGAEEGHFIIEYSNGLAVSAKFYDVSENLEYKIETVISDGKIVKIKEYYDSNDDGELDYAMYDTLFYTNGKITKVESFFVSNGEKSSYNTFTWTGNNISERKHYNKDYNNGQFVLTSTDTYEYDSKNNPFYNVGIGVLFRDVELLSENNVTKQTNVSSDNITTVYENTIEYNSKSYPTKITETNTANNNSSDVTEYTYY